MSFFSYKEILKVLLLLANFHLFFGFEQASAQRMTYDSTYQALPNLVGRAKFEYYLDKKEYPIKDGSFQFNQSERDSSCQNGFTYQQWEGNFEEGAKTGVWDYRRHSHLVDVSEADYGTAQYTVYSKRSEVSGEYREGLPEGDWNYQLTNYEGEKIINLPEIGSIIFFEGRASGLLQFVQQDVETGDTLILIAGEAQKGLMEGNWQFLYRNKKKDITIDEQRTYSKGILLELKKIVGEDTLTNLTFPLSPGLKGYAYGTSYKGEIVNRPLSLSFNDGYPRNSDWILSQKEGNKLLGSFLKHFSYYHPDVTEKQGLSVGTNRGFYPLETDEKKAAGIWLSYNVLLKERLQVLKGKSIEFHAYSQDSVLQWIQEWTRVQESVLTYTAPWIKLIERNELEFYYRKGVIVQYAQNLLERDTLRPITGMDVVLYKDQVKKEENRKSQDGFLNYIAQNFEQRLQLADSLTVIFGKQVEKLKVQKEILAIEGSLIRHKAELDTLFQEIPSMNSKSLAKILKIAKSDFLQKECVRQMDDFLSSYKNPPRQRDISDSLHINLNYLENIYGITLELEANLPKIDSIYTEYKFDPFTFSDRVPFRAQKTLYKTAIEVIMPFLFENAENASNTNQMLQHLHRADALIDRINLLREKNTKSLERKLKFIESPEEGLELINKFLK